MKTTLANLLSMTVLATGVAMAEPEPSSGELVDRIYFSSGSAALSKDAKPALSTLATLLLKDMSLKGVRIEGHTDQRGSDGANQLLSERRTKAVQNYLLAQGVPVTKILIVNLGARRPIRGSKDTVAQSRNRRVDLLLIRKQDNLLPEASPSE